ncbi:HAD family hydrolase [Roseovarius amoyensis]|uniref:HAD family hydrolase n=1 Tax=Roseovarius amoyensis TaxID=2211448 RepID=UPI000DBE5EE0|nr:HAD family hydrolase [Roseovarius amoyensis]
MVNVPVRKLDALLFDKDGTLFEFHATWSAWAHELIDCLAGGDPARGLAVAEAMAFDSTTGHFHPESPIIAQTNREAAECIACGLGSADGPPDIAALEALMTELAARAPLAPPVPLVPLLDVLRARGLILGVMTNDSETAAHAQLQTAGVAAHFDFIAGFDSGFGAKPDPDPLLAFARVHRLNPARVAMVGDSAHDLIAGRAAGMQTLAVLTGVAGHDDLVSLADAVLPDIGALPGWLDRP